MKIFAVAFFSFFTLAAISQTTLSKTMLHQGLTREYRIYIPAVYTGTTPVPLILNLHGYSSNNVQQEAYGDFRPIADTANFIIIHPNGTFDTYNQRFWNAFSYPAPAPDDLSFLSDLIDTISANYNIDQNAIYSTGMSNGGFMSYDLACFLSGRIAAIASVTGSMTPLHLASCNPGRPVPVMQIHGTSDMTVPYTGSSTMVHIDTLVKTWAMKNNCNLNPSFTNVPDVNTTDNCTAEHYLYPGGTGNSTIEFYKIIGGGHSWPGAPVNINVTNMDFNASVEIWRFFRQYKLNSLTSTNEIIPEADIVFPNPASSEIYFNSKENFLHVTDLLGRKYIIERSGSGSFDISQLPDGVYHIVLTKNNPRSLKFIRLGSE